MVQPARVSRLPARMPRRLVQLYAGLVLYGVSIALMVRSSLGSMPWDVLHQGLAAQLGWSLGVVVIAVGAVVLLAWIPLRERPGIGTISNVVVIGLAVDATLAVLTTPVRARVPAGVRRCGHRPQRRRHRRVHRGAAGPRSP
jgi:uncharacterized membrane protein YczE